MKIQIRPFSINKAWAGRRFKTKQYAKWREQFGWLCRPEEKIMGMFEIEIDFYVKNFKMVDTDNFAKPTMDALTECQIIDDDRFAKKITLEKFAVKKISDEKIVVRIYKNDTP